MRASLLLVLVVIGCAAPKARPYAPPFACPPAATDVTGAALASSIGALKNEVKACFDRFKAAGQVDLAVLVGADGSARNVDARHDGQPTPTSRCFADAFRGGHYPLSKQGEYCFSWPVTLH